MEIENLPFPDAVRLLAQRAGMEVPEAGAGRRAPKARALRPTGTRPGFTTTTSRAPAVRGCGTIAQRQVRPHLGHPLRPGGGPDQWDALTRALTDKGYSKMELIDAGLAVAGKNGGVYDKFRARLMLPVIDVRGGGGRLHQPHPARGGGAKYLNTRRRLPLKGRLIYALNFAKAPSGPTWCWWRAISTSSPSTRRGLTTWWPPWAPPHRRARPHPGPLHQELVLCYDNDAAGKSPPTGCSTF